MEYKRATPKNSEELNQQDRIKRQQNQLVFEQLHARDTDPLSIMETPYHPQIKEHAVILSRMSSSAERHDFIMGLHKTYGNRYVQHLVKSVRAQAKLIVSTPNDDYEQEADKVAEAVNRALGSQTQRQPEDEQKEIQTKLDSPIQRQDDKEEKKGVQVKLISEAQRKTVPEEEELQTKPASSVQRQEAPEEETLLKSTLQRKGLKYKELLSKTTVQAGAPASIALGANDYGLTFPESVDVGVTATRKNGQWQASVNSLTGNYSKQTRLLPGQQEVTGPGGNTTQGNYKAQVNELNALGYSAGLAKWYMLQAVVDHETVHANHFLPSLTAVQATIESDFAKIKVPHTNGKTQEQASNELRALPAFAAAKKQAQATWLTEILSQVAGDHNGPTDTAEHAVVDPMITTINNHAKAESWP